MLAQRFPIRHDDRPAPFGDNQASRPRCWLACFSLVLAALLLASGPAAAHADNPPNGITVTGQGTASLPPDLARVSGSVETQADTADAALNQNSQILQAAIAAVEASGIPEASIQTSGLHVNPLFSQTPAPQNCPSSGCPPQQSPYIVGYRATNGMTVKTTNLNQAGDLAQTMVDAGINNFNGISYDLQNPEQLRTMALQAAIGDAQQQAQAAAASLGVTLGSVLNFTEESSSAPPVAAPRAVAFAASAAAPLPPAMPGPINATSSVTVTFAIGGS